MREMRIDTDLTFCPADEDDKQEGWCWTVRLNGIQYASEVVPEKLLGGARQKISNWTGKALKETNPFYFSEVKR